ncbi:hypothetical protein V1503_19560 [Bacillus sp. SCS-151]|uniref:hypothetical protein n=1 Tax=Nanhaiella sioensis TaxID=3115293 RepID=UPI00397A0723
MRAIISDELLNAIVEMIYLNLEIQVLEKKVENAEESKEAAIRNVLLNVKNKRKETGKYLKDNNVTIKDVVDLDEEFVVYPYVQKINGGYKEGS